jgi:hypothetical protein
MSSVEKRIAVWNTKFGKVYAWEELARLPIRPVGPRVRLAIHLLLLALVIVIALWPTVLPTRLALLICLTVPAIPLLLIAGQRRRFPPEALTLVAWPSAVPVFPVEILLVHQKHVYARDMGFVTFDQWLTFEGLESSFSISLDSVDRTNREFLEMNHRSGTMDVPVVYDSEGRKFLLVIRPFDEIVIEGERLHSLSKQLWRSYATWRRQPLVAEGIAIVPPLTRRPDWYGRNLGRKILAGLLWAPMGALLVCITRADSYAVAAVALEYLALCSGWRGCRLAIDAERRTAPFEMQPGKTEAKLVVQRYVSVLHFGALLVCIYLLLRSPIPSLLPYLALGLIAFFTAAWGWKFGQSSLESQRAMDEMESERPPSVMASKVSFEYEA